MGYSERWQLGLAKVTAAFARGPAHFRSCLAKLCSTWWLVRSDKSTLSPTSTRTNTPPMNSSGHADQAIVTAAETVSIKAWNLSLWLVVLEVKREKEKLKKTKVGFKCRKTASLRDSRGRFWGKKNVCPRAHIFLWEKKNGLTLGYSSLSVLLWQRYWESSPLTFGDKSRSFKETAVVFFLSQGHSCIQLQSLLYMWVTLNIKEITYSKEVTDSYRHIPPFSSFFSGWCE